jgi:hypothetical protein
MMITTTYSQADLRRAHWVNQILETELGGCINFDRALFGDSERYRQAMRESERILKEAIANPEEPIEFTAQDSIPLSEWVRIGYHAK